MNSCILEQITQSEQVMAAILADKLLLAKVETAAKACVTCLHGGGSAADA